MGNTRLIGVSLTCPALPVPVSAIVCGLPAALSVIVTAPFRVPVFVGENAALMVQLPPGATDPPHVLLCAKSVALAPVRVMVPITSGPVPVFVSVAKRGVLVVPTI